MCYSCVDIVREEFNDLFLSYLVILVAGIGCNGKSRRNGHTDVVHLGKVGSFTAKCLTHGCITFGLTVSEGIDSFNV